MATGDAQIDCVNKEDRHNANERILHVGGPDPVKGRWKLSQQEATRYIGEGWTFWVNVANRRVEVIVGKSRFGNLYLRTTADGDEPNNLLSLPECR